MKIIALAIVTMIALAFGVLAVAFVAGVCLMAHLAAEVQFHHDEED